MSSASPVKSENDVNTVGYEDDDPVSPASLPPDEEEEDDVYEDSGDLDMSLADTKVWLVRMPKFLRERWLEMENSDGQDLGIIRLRQDNTNDIRLILADTVATKDLPHEYKLSVTNQNVSNTYAFAEQNLARYKDGNGRNQNGAASAPQNNGNGKSKRRRYQPYSRANIPKKTSIVGTVFHECSLTVSAADKSYTNFVAQRKMMAEAAPRPQVTLLNEIPGVTSAMAGPSMKDSNSAFMKAQKREKDRASAEGKAARIPKNELYDQLFKLFEEYDYWSMKGFRERTRQPEAYLKEVLESIAILNKKGPYALKYSLKPEYKGRKDNIVL
ncbi:transcription initiation factor IIF, beta subunit [Lipomyces tetrasporus]|uniref:Transcription initiation factor IIF subunit beta n=1 Tax=Lipomyces tetrasporus TaxID=54092 RepID=A0AAD7QSX8_9ASCO|nr:transcription initiation factor IIF, beta subunit [Lipomyces tetrasporus]KAJ8100401.1 transcription initiation factor IIF, beta subunit [Lipomyces tetrasporus]